jgi:hypothetical protein
MSLKSNLEIFIKQIKIYYRLQSNYYKFVKNKTPYFYIFTMPLFGFFFYLIVKLILLTNSNFFNKLLSYKVFMSSIRFLNPKEKIKISKIIPEYNNYQKLRVSDDFLGDKTKSLIQKELMEDGISNLGIIFSKQDCKNFTTSLNNQKCFNSQTQLQSDGVNLKFNSNKEPFNNNTSSYFCFEPSTNMNFKPLKNFLENIDLKDIVNNYLGLDSSIYFNTTWYNPPSNKKHYVHRLHRDYDDYKFLGLVIYWNDVNEHNGALQYVRGSHLDEKIIAPTTLVTGPAGTVILVDNFGLHRGSPVIKNERYTSTIRFGKYFNVSSVNCGFLT